MLISIYHIRIDCHLTDIFTTASISDWGAYCKIKSISRFSSKDEKKMRINSLEILALYVGLKCFAINLQNVIYYTGWIILGGGLCT